MSEGAADEVAAAVLGPDEAVLKEVERRLKVKFTDRSLLRQALVHKSLTNEQGRSGLESNERLEFLGDSILGAIVSEQLFRRFQDRDEGQLTLLRSSLVRASTLATWARALDLGGFVVVGRGELRAGGRDRDPLMASLFEAVLGAVYLDRGFATAARLVRRFVEPEMEERADVSVLDPKSRLQQLSQARFGITPGYEVLNVGGLGHSPIFTVYVVAGPGIEATAEGRSKQTAQQAAATEALRLLEELLAREAAEAGARAEGPALPRSVELDADALEG